MRTFIYTFRPLREGFIETMDPGEGAAFRGHVEYTDKLLAQGTIVFKGAAADGSLGIVVFKAPDPESADAIFSGDPATRLASLECRCTEFVVAMH